MEELYPKEPKPEKPVPSVRLKPWAVKYEELVYDGGGGASWTQYYYTRLGARFSAFMHYHIRSYGGGSVILVNRRKAERG